MRTNWALPINNMGVKLVNYLVSLIKIWSSIFFFSQWSALKIIFLINRGIHDRSSPISKIWKNWLSFNLPKTFIKFISILLLPPIFYILHAFYMKYKINHFACKIRIVENNIPKIWLDRFSLRIYDCLKFERNCLP